LEDKILYQLILNFAEGIGPVTARNLISYTGSVEAVFEESRNNLLRIPGVGPAIINKLRSKEIYKYAEEELAFAKKHNISILFYLDEAYPIRLRPYEHSPILLYKLGDADLDCDRTLAVVGTRKPTEYGRMKCMQILSDLANSGITVLSGLAYGIDGIAHAACIENDIPTVGVLGNGLQDIYPHHHRDLARKMIDKGGALISQFPFRAAPERERFPMRNRLVAAMSDATLVIESKSRGGSMITAGMAFELNKDVFALPGRAIDTVSGGCNLLIKRDMARLVETAEDLLSAMMWDDAAQNSNRQTELYFNLDETEQKIVSLIRENPEIHVDDLQYKNGSSTSELSMSLLQLELKGVVKQLAGKRYLSLI
jgi:DNA processing protein